MIIFRKRAKVIKEDLKERRGIINDMSRDVIDNLEIHETLEIKEIKEIKETKEIQEIRENIVSIGNIEIKDK